MDKPNKDEVEDVVEDVIECISESTPKPKPTVYIPTIDNTGRSIDKITKHTVPSNGVECQCGTRPGKSYMSNISLAFHCRTKTHRDWLNALNGGVITYAVPQNNNKTAATSMKAIATSTSTNEISDAISLRDERITSLENEVKRLTNDVLAKACTVDLLVTQLCAKKSYD